MSVKEEILKERNKEPFPFYGFSIAVLSLCFGVFLLIFGNYMDSLFSTLFEMIPDWPIAFWLVASAVVKLIGIHKRDKKLKRIGTEARQELEKLWGGKVFLELWVKVRSGWADDDARVRSFGYE